MNIQAFGYFLMQEIVNIDEALPDPMVVSTIQNLNNAQKIEHFYDRVFSDMIANAI